MHRAYVPAPWDVAMTLPDDTARHLSAVLRLKPGDTLEIFDGAGHTARCTVAEVSRKKMVVHLSGDVISHPPMPPFILVLGALKTETMDRAVRQATELGVTHIHVVTMKRSVVPLRAVRARAARWQKIARQACAQSRRSWEPVITVHASVTAFLEETDSCAADADNRLFFWEKSSNFNEIQRKKSSCVLVGPEGGITDAEAALLSEAGFEEHSLGPTILRADTAVVAALALSRPSG